MVDRQLEFFAERAGVFGRDARCQNPLAVFPELGRNLHDLFRRLAGAKDDFGKISPQRAVRVHLGKAEVGHRRGLECAQNMVAGNYSGVELFQQLVGFGGCHSAAFPAGQ
jgi:hypothetical protein